MKIRFVEVTDQVAYGKFIVARLDHEDVATPSAMPDAAGARLLTYGGRRRFNNLSTLVVDLQRGTGAAWLLGRNAHDMESYLREHLAGLDRLVCPMYFPFVRWLHEDGRWALGAGNIDAIPRYIELPMFETNV